MENWKPVIGFEESYLISDHGNLKSVFVSKIISPPKNQYGYRYHGFRKNKKRTNIQIHRAVAMAFIPNPENKPCVNHIDGNKDNNHVSNLEWVTYKENMIHASENNLCAKGERIAQSKLKQFQVEEIKEKYKTGSFTYSDLAEEYNVSFSLIGQIINEKIWKRETI